VICDYLTFNDARDQLGDLPVPQTVTGKEVYNRAEVARAILESNSYAVKGNIEPLEEIFGGEFEFLKFCGCNSKSDLLM
jgi:sugar (pentulose or hexulose) kinase